VSRVAEPIEVEYPESDGEPMGETDLHRRWMIRVIDLLEHRYRNEPRVYVSGDLLMYYVEGMPARYVVPDAFVVKDCEKRERRVFKTWEEQRVPNLVVEVTSRSTRRRDEAHEPRIYADLGVAEYFMYDPTADYLRPPLQGFRLVGTEHVRIEPDGAGRLTSEELGATLHLEDRRLVVIDLATGLPFCTESEANAAERETERTARETERAARLAAEAARDAAERELARLRQLLNETSPPTEEQGEP
jgi:Uma2 family endonuclease